MHFCLSNISVHRIETLPTLSFKIENIFVRQYSHFPKSAKIYTIFWILIRKWADFNVPLYKDPSLHWMLNPSSDEFTLHVTLQKSFSAVYSLYRIDSYIAESYFCCFYNYVACVCSKILLPLSYIFMVYFAQSFFRWFWIAGTAKPGCHALSNTLYWPANLYLVNSGRQQTFTVTALLQR